MTAEFRVERDSMGELRVPANALWGAQTQRAVNNFPFSGLPMPPAFLRALGLVKWAAADANKSLRLLPAPISTEGHPTPSTPTQHVWRPGWTASRR